MLERRGVTVDHSTLFRCVQGFGPVLEKRVRMIRRGHVHGKAQGPTDEMRLVNEIFGLAAA